MECFADGRPVSPPVSEIEAYCPSLQTRADRT